MPSTDIDGSPIVILSEVEGKALLNLLRWAWEWSPLNDALQRVAAKIARDLNLEPLCQSKSPEPK